MRGCFWKIGVTLMWLALFGCGLPTATSVNINNLNKPELNVYNQGDTLYLQITGYYPANEYPDFIGYNIYVGDNNDTSKVIKRVLYISSDDALPSSDVSLSLSTTNIIIPITDIRFRYSQYATADDIPDGVDRNALFSKPLVDYERYYFVAEAVETSRTGAQTDAVKTIFIKYENSQLWSYSNALSGSTEVDVFSGLTVVEDFFIFPSSSGYSFGITTRGVVDSVYQSIPKDTLAYTVNPYKHYLNHIYFFRAVEDASSTIQYLILRVEGVLATGLVVSYGHYQELLPDFINGVSQVVE